MTARVYAGALMALGSVLAAVNWYLRPERAGAWAAALLFMGVVALILLLVPHRSSGAARQAADSIAGAAIFGGLMMVVAMAGRLATALGASADADLARRASMVVMGGFLVFTGNAMPKMLTPLSAMRCDPARSQAVQRFVGWTWVLTGLAYAVPWLVLPLAQAESVSIVAVVVGMLLTLGRVFTAWRGPGQRPA